MDVIEQSPGEEDDREPNRLDNNYDVTYVINPKHEDRTSSFFAQPGVLAGELKQFLIVKISNDDHAYALSTNLGFLIHKTKYYYIDRSRTARPSGARFAQHVIVWQQDYFIFL